MGNNSSVDMNDNRSAINEKRVDHSHGWENTVSHTPPPHNREIEKEHEKQMKLLHTIIDELIRVRADIHDLKDNLRRELGVNKKEVREFKNIHEELHYLEGALRDQYIEAWEGLKDPNNVGDIAQLLEKVLRGATNEYNINPDSLRGISCIKGCLDAFLHIAENSPDAAKQISDECFYDFLWVTFMLTHHNKEYTNDKMIKGLIASTFDYMEKNLMYRKGEATVKDMQELINAIKSIPQKGGKVGGYINLLIKRLDVLIYMIELNPRVSVLNDSIKKQIQEIVSIFQKHKDLKDYIKKIKSLLARKN